MSNWSRLFGSPATAAQTIIDKELLYDLMDQCGSCPRYDHERCVENAFSEPCEMYSVDAINEWLMQEE